MAQADLGYSTKGPLPRAPALLREILSDLRAKQAASDKSGYTEPESKEPRSVVNPLPGRNGWLTSRL